MKTISQFKAGWTHYCIIFLLALLVGITGFRLYLDHFKGIKSVAVTEEKTTEESQPQVETTPIYDESLQESVEQIKPAPAQKILSASDVKVQVLNGCGVRGIAGRAREILRNRGFDVMSYGNARKQDYPQSLIIIRSEGPQGEQAAEIMAKSLGISTKQIQKEPDASLVDIDITLILGLDHRKLDLSSE